MRASERSSRPAFPGVVVAGATALVSGVAVFANSYGVHAIKNAAVYTTAKNLVAAVVLVALAGAARFGRRPSDAAVGTTPDARSSGRSRVLRWGALAYVGVVGGGVAFILFFQGLADTSAAPAAFLHDTMVLWVALLAPATLGERPTRWNVAAIVLLVGGEVAVSGGIGRLAAGRGDALVLVATVLWSVETVCLKGLLRSTAPSTLAVVRMGVGVVALVVYLAASGHLSVLTGLDAGQAGWALLTGGLLAAYVATWMVALSRARALDVTSVLVASVVVTTLLQVAAGHSEPAEVVIGLVLIAAGSAAVVRTWARPAMVR